MKKTIMFVAFFATFGLAMTTMAQEKQEMDLLFVGDSITDFWDNDGRGLEVYKKYYDNGVRTVMNIGVSGDITDQTMQRLQNPRLQTISPKMIMLMIGTNNMDRGPSTTAKYTLDGIDTILKTLREMFPEAKILLLAVFPRSQPETGVVPGRQYRDRIAAINARLPELADGKNIFFKDINAIFLNDDGTLKLELMPDQLHPNTAGYYLWAEAIEPIVKAWTGK
ncbi:MAG: GDSL-type esterase/lipase family protein [Planctomycetia bacterium]|nr:GDSL-type esterase/lipase family protein [Planctomycetia bacterium]